ncbi:response regulator [Ekhidna sp.]
MKRIVLIDDDATTNYLNKMIIERSALVDEVLTFDSAEEALTFFNQSNSPEDALVLLDINMPIMNGWQFLDQYGSMERTKSNKIVLLTSSINPSDKQLADEKLNVVDYMSKPLSVDMLQNLVSTYLN